MSWASLVLCVVLALGALACSEERSPTVAATVTPLPTVTMVFPTATPIPPEILNDGCPVTQPNGQAPPGETPRASHHGNGLLWTTLWPEGTVFFEPDGPGQRSDLDGSLSMKWPWWRGADTGPLTIEGRRLDADAPPLGASIPDGYSFDFQATALIFPTPGCWEVTGAVGEATLSFVVRVLSNYPPFVRYEVGDMTLDSCPVTQPNGVLPPGDDEALAYGSGSVSTYLWPDGRVTAESDQVEVRADGSLAVEWWWLRWTTVLLEVSGRRLDAASQPLRTEGLGASGEGVMRSVLVFPDPGCWEVTARMGDSGIVFITLVEGRH